MTLGVGAILSAEPADIVRKLTFATKEAASADHADLFSAMSRVNLAHAVMLRERGLVPPASGDALVGLMLEIFRQGRESVPLKAEAGDLYPQIEAYATTRLGAATAGYLQLGRSRGDVIPAAMRLKLRIKQVRLLQAQLSLRGTLLDCCQQHLQTIMPAYTHWQQSQVMTVGHFLGRFAAWFERDTERLQQCLARHDFSPLGSANGVGTSVKVDRDATAALLGHTGPVASAGDGTNAWDYMIEPVSDAALFTSHLARLMGNFILWHTQEFGMAQLSDAFATASTYLPQKRNPEPLETVKVFAEQVQGNLATVYLMARNEDWPHSLINHGFQPINQALDLSVDAAVLTGAILEDIQFNDARMREVLGQGFTTASEVANALVVQCGLPFREAHEIVGTAVRACLNSNAQRLTASHVREAAAACGVGTLDISDDILSASADPRQFIDKMDSAGGVAPVRLAEQIQHWRNRLADDTRHLQALAQRFEAADGELAARAQAIVGQAGRNVGAD